MKKKSKRSKNIFTYNGYILNHRDYNSKSVGVMSSKKITFFVVILIIIFLLIGILWGLKITRF